MLLVVAHILRAVLIGLATTKVGRHEAVRLCMCVERQLVTIIIAIIRIIYKALTVTVQKST
jgi:hypothetical protein